jgi:hypothetical protein
VVVVMVVVSVPVIVLHLPMGLIREGLLLLLLLLLRRR